MKEYFIEIQLSQELKLLGFKDPCLAKYREGVLLWDESPDDFNRFGDDIISAPLYRQAFEWMLVRHSLYGVILPTPQMYWTYKIVNMGSTAIETPPYDNVAPYDYFSIGEAEYFCLEEMINMIKEHNDTLHKLTV